MNSFSYEFTFDQKKNLNPEEQSTIVKAFKNYDKNGDGNMDVKEFKECLIDMGFRKITDDECSKKLEENDFNKDGQIQWVEFVNMQIKDKGHDADRFGKIVGGAAVLEGHGAKHTYLEEERATYARSINYILKKDADVADRLPINPDDESLFHVFDHGILLCKLVKSIDDDAIDSRAINMGSNMNVYQIKENLQMGIAACKGLGIKMIGINSNDFINKIPHMMLGTIWQLIRMKMTQSINLKHCPEIMKLAQGDETLQDLNKLAPEDILIRWINYHLEKAGQERRVKNLGKDLADSEALLYVLNQLDDKKCSLDGLNEADAEKKAQNMIDQASNLGVADITTAKDIVKANVKVNTIFVAEIFNTKHGLEELTKEEYDAAALIDDDIEGSIEERQFRLWINSLGIPDCYVNDLFDDCNDGVILCKVIDKIEPGTIDWKVVNQQPKQIFDKNLNCKHAIESGKKLNLKFTGIGGTDITGGNKKLILAVVWQLVRLHYLKLVGDKTEDDLVKWANDLVGGKAPSIANLKDKSMGNGQFLLNLCGAIEPRAVNWDIVLPGENEDDQKLNAKYVISVARKLGATIFCVWEDIVNVNPKQMLIFIACMNEIQQELAAAK